MKKLVLISVSVIIVAAVIAGYLFTNRTTVTANSRVISLDIQTAAAPFQDVETTSPNRNYYLTTLTGDGTARNSFCSRVSEYAKNWGMIDLRPDPTRIDGYCLAYTDDIERINGVNGIMFLSNGLDLNTTLANGRVNALNSTLDTSYKYASLPELVHEMLTVGRFSGKLRPEVDGKERINLGGQIWGEAKPALTHTTNYDTFNRGDADALGTSSDATFTWVEQNGDSDILSNQAVMGTGGADPYNYANISLGSADHYSQADVWSAVSDGNFVTIRHSTAANTFYAGGSNGWEGGSWRIYEVTAGSWTSLDADATGWSAPAGETFYLEGSGSSITFKVEGATLCTATDASLSTNYVGLAAWDAGNAKWDNFEASALGAGTPSMSVAPSSKAFGILHVNTVNWSKGAEPSWPLDDSEAFFYLYNDGTTLIDVSANATNGTGGAGSTLTSAAVGADTFRVSLFAEGDGSADNLTLTTTQQAWLASLATSSNTSWEVKLEIGTSTETPPTGKTFYIYLICAES